MHLKKCIQKFLLSQYCAKKSVVIPSKPELTNKETTSEGKNLGIVVRLSINNFYYTVRNKKIKFSLERGTF